MPDCNSVGAGLLGAGDLTERDGGGRRGRSRHGHRPRKRPLPTGTQGPRCRRSSTRPTTSWSSIISRTSSPTAPRSCCRQRPSPSAAAPSSTTKAGRSASSRSLCRRARSEPSWRWLSRIRDAHGRHGINLRGRAPTKSRRALAEERPDPRPHRQPRCHARASRRHAGCPARSHRFSGRTAIHAHLRMREPKPPDDPESPLAYSMEGSPGPPPAPSDHPLLVARLELGAVAQPIPGGDRRRPPRRRPRCSPHRAETDRGPCSTSATARGLHAADPASGCWCRSTTSSAPSP